MKPPKDYKTPEEIAQEVRKAYSLYLKVTQMQYIEQRAAKAGVAPLHIELSLQTRTRALQSGILAFPVQVGRIPFA